MPYAPAVDVTVPDTEIESGNARLWQSGESRTIGPWLARIGRVDNRTNTSVAVLGSVDDVDIPGLLAAVEGFYAERGRPTRFQLAATDRTEAVRRVLTAAGYVPEGSTTLVRIANVRALRGIAPQQREGRVRVQDAPKEDWFGQWWTNAGSRVAGTDAEAAMDVLWDLPGRCAFASHVVDGEVVATGLGVVDGPWLGVYCLSTRPDRLRVGSVRRVVGALATWGNALAARGAYLRVPADADDLVGFTDRCGFVTSYTVESLVAGS